MPFRTPTPPQLPGYIPIESAVPCAEPFDDHDWLFSVDWDGARALLFLDPGGGVRIQGEMVGDLARRFPDVSATASSRRGGVRCWTASSPFSIVKGVPTSRDSGGGSPPAPRRPPSFPRCICASTSCTWTADRPSAWPLDRRLDALRELTSQSDVLQAPDHVRGRGEALAAAASGRGLVALLARRAAAPYRPGVASPDRMRIALSNQTTCVIAGIVTRRRGGTRLILGEHVDGRLTFAGHVDGPSDRLVEGWLARQAAALTGHECAAGRCAAGQRHLAPSGPHGDRPVSGSECGWGPPGAGAPRRPR